MHVNVLVHDVLTCCRALAKPQTGRAGDGRCRPRALVTPTSVAKAQKPSDWQKYRSKNDKYDRISECVADSAAYHIHWVRSRSSTASPGALWPAGLRLLRFTYLDGRGVVHIVGGGDRCESPRYRAQDGVMSTTAKAPKEDQPNGDQNDARFDQEERALYVLG